MLPKKFFTAFKAFLATFTIPEKSRFQKFLNASDLFQRIAKAATSAIMPIMIKPIGDIAKVILSAAHLAFIIAMAPCAIVNAVLTFIIALLTPIIMPIALPSIIKRGPSTAAILTMVSTVALFSVIQADHFVTSSPTFVSTSFAIGSKAFPSSSTLLCICCCITLNFCSGVEFIAAAISLVTETPFFILTDRSSIPPLSTSTLL